MKSTVLNPDKKNLIDTFINDEYGRCNDIFDFMSLLSTIEGSYSIALNAQWGAGKTFFVKQIKMLLEVLNSHVGTDLNEKEESEVRKRWSQTCTDRKLPKGHDFLDHVPIYYDAWMNDNDEDPLLSLVYSITLQMKNTTPIKESPDVWKSLKSAVAGVAALVSQSEWGPLAGAANAALSGCENNDPLEVYEKKAQLRERIYAFFDSLLKERASRLVVFIDELDRCKPTFAVQLLERIKHYFNHENITFVFSVNVQELCHTVKTLYGQGFDAGRYLDRFFDLRVELPEISGSYGFKMVTLARGGLPLLCQTFVTVHRLSLRVIPKYLQHVKSAVTFMGEASRSEALAGRNGMKAFCRSIVLPVAIGLLYTDREAYLEFIEGKNSVYLENVILNELDHGEDLDAWLSQFASADEKNLPVEEKIEKLCRVIFSPEVINKDISLTACGLTMTPRIQEKMLQAIQSIRPYAATEPFVSV